MRRPSLPVDDCAIVDASGDPARTVAARRSSRVPRIRAPRPSMVRRVDRRFWVLATVIVVLILAAAAIFQVRRQDIGVVDAIYEAFASILGNADPSGLTTQDLKFFAIGLAIVGAIVLAAFYGLVVDVLMKTRVSSILGPHVGDARDHVIIVGFGSLGYRVGDGAPGAGHARGRGRCASRPAVRGDGPRARYRARGE